VTAARHPGTVDQPVRTVFVGSGAFGAPIAEAVAGHPSIELVGVVSAPDRPAGRRHRVRRAPVAELAVANGWELLQPTRLRSDDAIARVRELDPALLLLADYGRIVPAALLELPHGALNVHPSLLPRYRGASPIQATLLAGDDETGVTVIRMDAGVDTGPIVAQERTDVLGGETAPELEARLAAIGARVLVDALSPWLAGLITARPQPEEGATLTHVLQRSDGHVDWGHDAAAIERHVRAFQPWPGTWTSSPAGQLTIWRARVVDEDGRGPVPDAAPGTVVPLGHGLGVVTGSGVLALEEVQLASGRRIRGEDLRNGHPGLVGERLS
jgi:methionyl-tRNA formyltransferase